MSLFHDLQAEGEYVQPTSTIQSQSDPRPSPQSTAWRGKHLRERPRHGRPDPYYSTRKRPRQGPGPLRPLRERHARERECHGIYPTSRRHKTRQSIGSPSTSIPTSDSDNAPLRSLLGTSTTEESGLGFFSHMSMSNDAQDIHASKVQHPWARSRHLYGTRNARIKQGGPNEAFAEELDETESGLGPGRSIAVEDEVGDGYKDAEDTLVRGMQVDGIVYDDATVRPNSKLNMAAESGPEVNNVALRNSATRTSQWFPIGLTVSILCCSLVTWSWPASKFTLTCAVVAITVKLWTSRKDRKTRNKPSIASDEALASNCGRTANDGTA